MQDIEREVCFERLTVDCNLTFARLYETRATAALRRPTVFTISILFLLNLVQLNCFGVLRGMGMLRTGIHLEVLEDSLAQTGFGKHTANGLFDHELRLLLQVVLSGRETLAAGITVCRT